MLRHSSDLREWNEDECALVHPRVWHGRVRLLYDGVPEEQQVEIDRARRVGK